MPRVNFDEIQENEIIPEGEYACSISRIIEKVSRAGNEMWKLELEIIEGDFCDRKIYDFIVFTQKAYFRVKNLCLAVGIRATGSANLMPAMFEGKKCTVEIVHTEWEGKDQAKVATKGYSKLDDSTMPPVKKEEFPEPDLPF